MEGGKRVPHYVNGLGESGANEVWICRLDWQPMRMTIRNLWVRMGERLTLFSKREWLFFEIEKGSSLDSMFLLGLINVSILL